MRREEKCEKSDQSGESCIGEGGTTGDDFNNEETSAPPPKRRREDDGVDLYQKECEDEIFKDQLAREMEKKKPKISRLKELMDATHNTRRVWIESNAPSVIEVFEEYPSLKHGKLVSYIILYS